MQLIIYLFSFMRVIQITKKKLKFEATIFLDANHKIRSFLKYCKEKNYKKT